MNYCGQTKIIFFRGYESDGDQQQSVDTQEITNRKMTGRRGMTKYQEHQQMKHQEMEHQRTVIATHLLRMDMVHLRIGEFPKINTQVEIK